MQLLYINNLKSLPNFGCRTTGTALEELLNKKHTVIARDGLETIYNSGWDAYSQQYYKLGGLIPDRIFGYLWRRRSLNRRMFSRVCQIESRMGALLDYITQDVHQSVGRFHQFKHKYPDLRDFEEQVNRANAIAINGEGTLIFGRPTMRDALYLLFVIALARSFGKPVFLLNAMITQCPYTGAEHGVVEQAADLLKYCSVIACREQDSFNFTASIIGSSSLRLVPDALFTWGEKIRHSALAIKQIPDIFLPFGTKLTAADLNFGEPYICVSASSSAWRSGNEAIKCFVKLATALKATGLRIYFIATCAGDAVLHQAAHEASVTLIPQDISALAGAGIIAGASAYISGRYHPAIMAGAGGVPTVFLSSNSHKTRTVQTLLGYDAPKEYGVAPTNIEISAIVSEVEQMILNKNAISKRIRSSFDLQAEKAREFETIIAE